MCQADILFNRVQRQSNLAADTVGTPNGSSSLTGLGLNYNLSKNTMIYGRYEKASNIVAIAGSTVTTANNSVYRSKTITAAGLIVKF